MKELTIEQKAKAYDEAIDRAKKWHNAPNADKIPTLSTRVIEEIFPELRENEDERIRKAILIYLDWLDGRKEIAPRGEYSIRDMIAWLEKQSKQEQLYIRFGEIPTDEKSKIYQGEAEVGIENGVSVYPAFETNEGDIVLGLNLPITKTTLYTQQHLLEYEDRPCYLVKGNYVGKDTDGQPLIDNVSIIGKIDSYRVKEEKVDKQNCVKLNDKVEPKFHKDEWITNGDYTWKVVEVNPLDYILQSQDGDIVDDTISHVDEQFHSFTVEDVKDGDVLCSGQIILLFKQWEDNADCNFVIAYAGIDISGKLQITDGHWLIRNYAHPATKEQRDTLMKAMVDAGYTFDFKKKKLKKIEDEIETPFGAKDSELQEATYFIPKGFHAEIDDDKVVIKKGEKPTEWSEEDKEMLNLIIEIFEVNHPNGYFKANELNDPNMKAVYTEEIVAWLKSLKDRVQPKQGWDEWDEDDIYMLEQTIKCVNNSEKLEVSTEEIEEWLKALGIRMTNKQ